MRHDRARGAAASGVRGVEPAPLGCGRVVIRGRVRALGEPLHRMRPTNPNGFLSLSRSAREEGVLSMRAVFSASMRRSLTL